MKELLKNKGFLAFLGLVVGFIILFVIINSLIKTTTEDGEEIGALSALWRRLTKKKDVIKKDDTDVVKKDDTDVVVDDDVVDTDDVSFTIKEQTVDGQTGCDTPLKSSVTITGTTYPSRIQTNSIPNHPMDGTGNGKVYATCPSEQSDDDSLSPPSEECNDGKYFNKNKCEDIPTNPNQAQFSSLGIVGRPAKEGHWSSSNPPQEAIDYDPTPAECWNVTPHTCGADNKDGYRYNIYGANNWTNGTIYHKDGVTCSNQDNTGRCRMNVGVDAYNAHVQPSGAYHYHPPLVWDNGDYADKVIGYLYDGIPIMGTGSKVLTANGEEKIATSSYIINEDWTNKAESDGQKCPSPDDIPKTPYEDGEQALFHSCYKFEEGAGNLDIYNGGISPALDGEYAYFATGKQYPYLPIFIKGEY